MTVTPDGPPAITLIPIGQVWRYLDNGSDQGIAWQAPGFPDGSWLTGTALFGNDTVPYPYPFITPLPRGGGRITYYFRTSFNWSGSTVGVTLVSSNSIDDGAVFYLNGVEVGRRRVSAGQNYLTTADNQGNEGIVEPILFSSASLMQGPNVMAVEVHQTSVTSSDIAFGMTLTARTLCTPPAITTQPSDATVTQCPTATFTVAATGSAPLAYVWCRDGVVIGGAINASYTTPPLALADDGKVYTVKITNPCGTVTSAGAVLHVARPPNDTPATASALTAPATVSGSLLYAGTTPPGVVGTFPPLTPTLSQQNAPDVWYSFSPTVDGVVTVDTCGAVNCPGDTVLAVYQGSPAALLYNPSGLSGQNWYNDNMSPVCGLNPQAAQVKFDAKACTTYYIRVSARSANNPPGGFTLNLTQPPAPMAPNDACNLATSVSANSSTRFNNRLASTSATPLPVIYNDVWFKPRIPKPESRPERGSFGFRAEDRPPHPAPRVCRVRGEVGRVAPRAPRGGEGRGSLEAGGQRAWGDGRRRARGGGAQP